MVNSTAGIQFLGRVYYKPIYLEAILYCCLVQLYHIARLQRRRREWGVVSTPN